MSGIRKIIKFFTVSNLANLHQGIVAQKIISFNHQLTCLPSVLFFILGDCVTCVNSCMEGGAELMRRLD